jgi:hypothetical protein
MFYVLTLHLSRLLCLHAAPRVLKEDSRAGIMYMYMCMVQRAGCIQM